MSSRRRAAGNDADRVLTLLTAPLRLALEARAPWEHGAALAAQPLLALARKGDGHPVLVLPLMFGSDLNTLPLRRYLAGRGYAVSAWGQGVNLGPRAGVLDACRARLDALCAAQGRAVSLVGWSLGGLYARELAKQAPAQVRCVVTLGAPLDGESNPVEMWRAYERVTGEPMGLPETHSPLAEPPPVPCTAIVSRSDGIVAWPGANESSGPLAETIEIESSHLGMAMHPLAVHAIADRLAQPEGDWQPFHRNGLRGWLYADPERPARFW
jgi:pimeloyl-ACP methyl ester carboxylesterase